MKDIFQFIKENETRNEDDITQEEFLEALLEIEEELDAFELEESLFLEYGRAEREIAPDQQIALDRRAKIKIIKTKDNKFQVQRFTKGKFVNQGKPYESLKQAEKERSSVLSSMQFEESLDEFELEESVELDEGIVTKTLTGLVDKGLNKVLDKLEKMTGKHLGLVQKSKIPSTGKDRANNLLNYIGTPKFDDAKKLKKESEDFHRKAKKQWAWSKREVGDSFKYYGDKKIPTEEKKAVSDLQAEMQKIIDMHTQLEKMMQTTGNSVKYQRTMEKLERDTNRVFKDIAKVTERGDAKYRAMQGMDNLRKAKKLTHGEPKKGSSVKFRAYANRGESVELDEKAPKMKGDWLKQERERNNKHDAAMGRTKTGRKKPTRTMTSTQKSLASMRGESVELDEGTKLKDAINLAKKNLNTSDRFTTMIGIFNKGDQFIPGDMKFRDKMEKDGYDWVGHVHKDGSVSLKKGFKESVELDEASEEGKIRVIDLSDAHPDNRMGAKEKSGYQVQRMTKGKFVNQGKPYKKYADAKKVQQGTGQHSMQFEEKSGTGYELYHRDFSGAMGHAYAHAKKKFGITVDSDEIDDKVAMGPRKPGNGKTNTYRLKGDKGNIQVQVYNRGGSKPFELNMYKESVIEDAEMIIENVSPKKIAMLKKQYSSMPDRLPLDQAMKISKMVANFDKASLMKVAKADIKWLSSAAKTNLISKHGATAKDFKESVELDESKWEYQDARGVTKTGSLSKTVERQGTDVSYIFKGDDGKTDVVSGSRLKKMKKIKESVIDEAKTPELKGNPFKYYKKPTNKKEAQSNVNFWHYVGMADNDEIEDMGKIPANYKSYAKSMKQDAQRELKKMNEAVEMVCEDCGCEPNQPQEGCECPNDNSDLNGDHWDVKGEDGMNESYVPEKLGVGDGMKAWIADFKKSDAPQFKGASVNKRRKMAYAAYMDAKRG